MFTLSQICHHRLATMMAGAVRLSSAAPGTGGINERRRRARGARTYPREPRLRRFRAQPPLPRVHRRGDPGRSCRSAEGPDHRDRRVRTRCRNVRCATRSGGPHRGGQAAPEAGTLLPDRRPAGPDPDRHSEGHLRADFRASADTRPWTLPVLRPANLPRQWCGPRRPAHARPRWYRLTTALLAIRFSGRWDGLARTCSLPDCGPAAAGTR